MQAIAKRLSALRHLWPPLILASLGIVGMSLGLAYFVIAFYRTLALPGFFYYLTLQFLDRWLRGWLLFLVGVILLAAGIWKLSGVAVIPLDATPRGEDEFVLGFRRASRAPRITVLSGGAGLLILASLGRYASRLTCITPVQDPVEYYYRASSLYHFENVIFVPPTPTPMEVEVELDDGARYNIKENISHREALAQRHVVGSRLVHGDDQPLPAQQPIFRQASDALRNADAIVLGPGSLFESILPNLQIPEVGAAIQSSRARTIYICSLMTEPGLTTGFGVA